jgi:alpha-amylase/alpha-mannosidase (GH57 family)
MKRPDSQPLKVVLCWHMHQPQYRETASGTYALPWTYLHAIKDYADMAAHLEAVPAARAVVNFAPILLEQLVDYAQQIERFLAGGDPITDSLLAALGAPDMPVEENARLEIIRACLRANEQRLIKRFPAFERLAALARWVTEHPGTSAYVSRGFVADLLVWYHLAWMGEMQRRADARIHRLQDKAGGYTADDRRELLAIIGKVVGGIIPRYRNLAARGQVELSTTPYAHPILPLMIDVQSAREAWPEAQLPDVGGYPGGEQRARWHVEEGLRTFERHFGFRPAGCWPAEGSVSTPAVRLLGEAGFIWCASGENVLRNSLTRAGHASHAAKEAWLYLPYTVAGASTRCFFRDDALSDEIGFTYATWHADDAVANLVHRLEEIEQHCRGHEPRVVSIILDGENAWEYYPENAYYFLSALYRRLSEHPRIVLTTYSESIKTSPGKSLPGLVAGSWVYGTFSTWIGDAAKNRGWELLVHAKRAADEVFAQGSLSPDQRSAAERQLAICEGSDWCWWFGDYNPANSVSDFERLYRSHLTDLYRAIGRDVPEELKRAVTTGGGAPAAGGVMRKGTAG